MRPRRSSPNHPHEHCAANTSGASNLRRRSRTLISCSTVTESDYGRVAFRRLACRVTADRRLFDQLSGGAETRLPLASACLKTVYACGARLMDGQEVLQAHEFDDTLDRWRLGRDHEFERAAAAV